MKGLILVMTTAVVAVVAVVAAMVIEVAGINVQVVAMGDDLSRVIIIVAPIRIAVVPVVR
jgi:hypothetical protein